jgi:hypothetical protein
MKEQKRIFYKYCQMRQQQALYFISNALLKIVHLERRHEDRLQ